MKTVGKMVLTLVAALSISATASAADKLLVKDNAIPTPNTVFKVDDAGTITSSSSTFSFDSVNKRLGIGIAVPTGNLDVVGASFPTARVMRQVAANNTYSAMGVALQRTDTTPTNGFGPGFILQSVGPTGIINNAGVVYGVTESFSTAGTTASVGGIRFGVFNNSAAPNYALNIISSGYVGLSTLTPTATLDVNGNGIRIRTAKTPASATDTCNAGDIAWDSNYIYVCVATNSWKRTAIATWP